MVLLAKLTNAGLIVRLSESGGIRVAGNEQEVDRWSPMIIKHKRDIIEQLTRLDNDLEKIRSWLFSIGEPESDHHLVIERCRSDPEVLNYYLHHVNGEYESGYSVTIEQDADDRVRCMDCAYLSRGGHCQQWKKTNPYNPRYRPEQKTKKACGVFASKVVPITSAQKTA